MSLIEDRAATLAADAAQAAYFREALLAQREQILDTVIKRGPGSAQTAASQARRAESEIRHIERLIEGLDRRFGSSWGSDR